ncbi:hypothetical protein [Pseudomonas chlororaphis]|uniref:hypothetical protein n=1 Tax=Pseudomonas chlororaphis TaxID=587753 RepID=UPI0020A0DE51|nr:hypothetical protein [Pseudomonas chlororaphis]MCP1478186.1 hypothetical protein [Pseudomonas chlororaphis]MCP1595462.1 hypothetical protein [Pseudomonas chlororaphis]WDG52752.1 hypothetical protein PUP76_23230 [Pseudomonas chlororaphis]WDH86227.1 hypothetical protein PUP74_18950 [Pseudomonas chlororaphis]
MLKKVIADVRKHVEGAYNRLDPKRFSQEPNYVAALFGRLDGVPFEKGRRRLEIISTLVNDHGPGAAESEFGADFSIAAEIHTNRGVVRKSILGQAKKGKVEKLPSNERRRLVDQCKLISLYTDALFVLETPEQIGDSPKVRIPIDLDKQEYSAPMELADYIVFEMLRCRHGDKRLDFYKAVQDSSLKGLRVITRDIDFSPSFSSPDFDL